MSDATDALTEALTDLAGTQFPSTFTVQGRAGSIACLLDQQNFREELSVGGTRGKDAATLVFANSSTYTPAVGDRITVAGVLWVVDSRAKGQVNWTLQLISDDE